MTFWEFDSSGPWTRRLSDRVQRKTLRVDATRILPQEDRLKGWSRCECERWR